MTTAEKMQLHKTFWAGDGPCLLLVPPGRNMDETWQVQIYDTGDYRERFYNPQMMWENEIARARPILDWPTDGIPTVRPNLGVIFVPSIAGQAYEIRAGQMPWCREPLSVDQIRAVRQVDVAEAELMKLAAEFYRIHNECGDGEIAAYHADTQGIFDTAHLAYGDGILMDMMDADKVALIDEVLEICCDLMVRAAKEVKRCIGEDDNWMIHGHGTEQGIYFPHVGLRISEDSPAMISPDQIDRFVIDSIERCAEQFGGIFMHYCGKHEYLFERLCRCDGVKAIDLGNPESYDTQHLLEVCGQTDTVLYSRVAADEREKAEHDWQGYLRRLAGLAKGAGARVALRPLVYPQSRDDCNAMLDLWHEFTA